MTANTRELAEDDLAALEEQRDFLLDSLDDLDREFAAGDIEQDDYDTLREDYKVRAAATIRSIEAKKTRVAKADSTGGGTARKLAWIAGVAIVAILAGVLIARSSGSRLAGEFGSGEGRASTPSLLLKASSALDEGDFDAALGLYDEVLEIDPLNAEALTYRGWVWYRQDPSPEVGRADEAIENFAEASAADPTYPDALVFAAIVRSDRLAPGDLTEAANAIRAFDQTDRDSFMESLVEQRDLRETIAARLFEQADPPTIEASPYNSEEVVAVARSAADKALAGEAITLFGAVLAEEPDNVEALTYQGWFFARLVGAPPGGLEPETLDRFADDAFTLFNRAIELDPTYPDVWAWRAFLHNQLGNIDQAKSDAQTFLDLPNQPAEIVDVVTDPQYGLID